MLAFSLHSQIYHWIYMCVISSSHLTEIKQGNMQINISRRNDQMQQRFSRHDWGKNTSNENKSLATF